MKTTHSRMTRIVTLLVCLLSSGRLFADDSAAKPRNETQANLLRHSVGGLAALNIYNTFGCIGLAADLYKSKEYDASKVEKIMQDVIRTSDLSVQMLKNFDAGTKGKSNQVPVADLIASYRLLDREARLLMAAVQSGDKLAMQKFYQAREESWAKAKRVLGIVEDKPAETGKKQK